MNHQTRREAPRPAKLQTGVMPPRPGGAGQLGARPMTGRIRRLMNGQGHGFIRAADDREMFFHHTDVSGIRFNSLAVGDGVVFEVFEDRVTGPRALRVQAARPLCQGPQK
jgi:cold shock CspA family protein